jgi:hypothetical protein
VEVMNISARLRRLFRKKQLDAVRAPSIDGLVFRLRFTLPQRLAIQSNDHSIDFPSISENKRFILAASDNPQLKNAKRIVLKGGPFATEEEAYVAGECVRKALMLSLTRMRMGANFGADEPRSVLTEYGRQFLGHQIGGRVLQDIPQVIVYDDSVPTRFANLDMSGVVGKPPDRLESLFRSALEVAPEFSEREQLAIELFGAAFFEPSVRSRFVTLMIAVEALLEPKQRSTEAIKLVESFMEQVRASPALTRSEIDSLCGTLKWLKNESINRTGQDLASERLAGHQYLGMLPGDFFRHCYEVRSNIVHTGAVRTQGADLGSLAPELESFVADLICSRFTGLADYP